MPGKRAARPPRKDRALRTGIAAVAVLVIGGLGWSAVAAFGGGDDDNASPGSSQQAADATSSPTSSPTPSADSSPASSPSDTASAQPAAVRACDQEVKGAEKVVAAAEEGVENWHKHVQARTDMLNGTMSVEEMDRMWEMTKVAGPTDQRRFHAALDTFDPTPACDDLADASDATAAAADCSARYDSAQEAVDAAEAAMADWQSHLVNMAAYAAGKMPADEAQAKWVEAWRNAPPHINAFVKARETLADAPSCPT